MKAKKVYESLGDIFKGKDIKDIKGHLDLKKFPPEYQEVLVALVNHGYIPKLFGGYDPDEYKDRIYTYQDIQMLWSVGLWINLNSCAELKEMDLFFHGSSYDERPYVETAVIVHKLENDSYVINVNIHFRGTWKSRRLDDKEFNGDKKINKQNEIIPTILKLVDDAEVFLQQEIDKLKEFGENW